MYLKQPYRRLNTPKDIKKLFDDYSLSISGLITGATSNAKISKNLTAAMPPAVILHHLPDKQISAVINSDNAAETINRQYIKELADLSKKFNLESKLKNYSGCPYSSAGCRRSCLVFSGRSNIFKAVQYARGRRTLAAIDRPTAYARGLVYSIAHHFKKQAGGALSCRLKGTDENNIHFKKITLSINEINNLNSYYGLNIIYSDKPRVISEIFKNDSIIFYEYSKAPLTYLNRLKALGVDVTASLVADRITGARDAISAVKSGYRLAVPVTLDKADRIPRRVIISDNSGRRVDLPAISFDNYDFRPADPQKCAGILKAKKSAGGDILSAFFVADKVGRQYIGGGTIELIY